MYEAGKLILGLETGLGGSVSILENGRQIDFLEGAGGVSRSEDLLILIEKLLERNGLDKKEIGLIAVSDSPGSLTGIRIGLSMAEGLADSLSANIFRISVLQALAAVANIEGRVFTAVTVESEYIYCRQYRIRGGHYRIVEDSDKKVGAAEFRDLLKNLENKEISFVCNEDLRVKMADYLKTLDFRNKIKAIYPIGGNFAEILGRSAQIIAGKQSTHDSN